MMRAATPLALKFAGGVRFRSLVPLGHDDCAIREWERCTDCIPVPLLGDEISALYWLRQWKSSCSTLHRLRTTLVELGFMVDRLEDEEVLAQLSWLLAAGRFHICYERIEVVAIARGTGSAKGKEQIAREQTRPRPVFSASQPEPATLPGDVDAGALAAVQRQASQSGVPFCEECVKAAASGN